MARTVTPTLLTAAAKVVIGADAKRVGKAQSNYSGDFRDNLDSAVMSAVFDSTEPGLVTFDKVAEACMENVRSSPLETALSVCSIMGLDTIDAISERRKLDAAREAEVAAFNRLERERAEAAAGQTA